MNNRQPRFDFIKNAGQLTKHIFGTNTQARLDRECAISLKHTPMIRRRFVPVGVRFGIFICAGRLEPQGLRTAIRSADNVVRLMLRQRLGNANAARTV